MRIEGKALVSGTPAVALHGFVFRTNFGDIVRRRSPRAPLSLPFASRTFVRSAGIDCARRLRSFLGEVSEANL
jgi:hypothetical protein